MTDPSPEAKDQLAAGLACLMIVYPAVVATRFAWTALVVGASSLAVLLLAWGVLQLLCHWKRCPEGDLPLLFTACLLTSLVYLAVFLSGAYPEGIHPLPLLLTPLLLTFQALPLFHNAAAMPRKALSQLAALGGFAMALLIAIGVFRELITFGTVFVFPENFPASPGFLSSVPAGLIIAGCMLAGIRWILGKITDARQGGAP